MFCLSVEYVEWYLSLSVTLNKYDDDDDDDLRTKCNMDAREEQQSLILISCTFRSYSQSPPGAGRVTPPSQWRVKKIQ